MGGTMSVLVAFGLAVHLIETVLLLGEDAQGWLDGLPACLPLD
jgi:hypothetical protein